MKQRKKRYINQRKRKRNYRAITLSFTESYGAHYRDTMKSWFTFISKEKT